MNEDPADAQILSEEKWAIELLASETHAAIAMVQAVFLIEYKKLAATARITSYLPLLARNRARMILEAQNTEQRI